MENSKIGWTHHTWNPWWGCDKVSAGCKHCYIDPIMRRSGNEPFGGPKKTSLQSWRKPFAWNRDGIVEMERWRIFTCSMSDFFHPGADAWRPDAWKTIKACDQLDWLILTKSPERIGERLPAGWGRGYPNVWLGVTVESQEYLQRVDILARIPAAVRFISAEPLLGRLSLGQRLRKVDWVITGCENAARAKRRVMQQDWVRHVADQCLKYNVPLFHKQYYRDNQLTFDGFVDGVCHQNFPASPAAAV